MSDLDLSAMKLDEAKPKQAPSQFVFRCRVNRYVSQGVLVEKVSYRLLQRKSIIRDESPLDHENEIPGLIMMPSDPVDGALYFAQFVEDFRDWETGYLEQWHWELVPYTEPTIESEGD